MGGAHESHEHAEHVAHAGHEESHGGPGAEGGFQGRVALTMAIVAALLAVVTMLSHRSHNEHIVLQTEATRLETQASILHTRASDTWAFYQAKKTRQNDLRSSLALLPLVAREPASEAVQKQAEDWRAHIAAYDSDKAGELSDLKAQAESLTREAETKRTLAVARIDESGLVHLRSDRYDLAELGAEIALVLCSISLLTKRRVFWGIAVVFALAGSAGALTAWQGIALGEHPKTAGPAGEAPHEPHEGH